MKSELFDELLASAQEMDEIVHGNEAATRITERPDPEVKLNGNNRDCPGGDS
ncbi:hypothetical protein [Marinimicrobium sp. LS-A18]|uniref:hypothetical protein n=1 Tax=Marinimicrobium sp. LS-A18 TaxID=1381596 RepID=UPI0004B7054C|nr:hypothetical protein [Marinimicrobium sp. LS-A18]